MSELTFDDYSYHALGTSYFLDERDPVRRGQTIYFGFHEEINEFLTDPAHGQELTALYRGQEVDDSVRQELSKDKISEAGDVLFYIAAAGLMNHVPLREVGARAVELYSGQDAATEDESFAELDVATADKMMPQVRPDYSPNYFGMQFFNLPPYEISVLPKGALDSGGNIAHGPLTLLADGLYALERLSRSFGNLIRMDELTGQSRDYYVREAALLMGGLSAVLQNRLGSNLAEAAKVNMQKRERRAAKNTLQGGSDPERSRGADQTRPRIGGYLSTELNLYGRIAL